MDLTEAEDIKKRWQEYTEELYKKDLHRFEKLSANVGDKVEFDVLMVSSEEGIKVADEAKAFKAVGEVLEQGKDKKVVVYKYKAKKNERKKQGHRQPFTAVKILEIVAK